jgi:hypothetical protein
MSRNSKNIYCNNISLFHVSEVYAPCDKKKLVLYFINSQNKLTTRSVMSPYLLFKLLLKRWNRLPIILDFSNLKINFHYKNLYLIISNPDLDSNYLGISIIGFSLDVATME